MATVTVRWAKNTAQALNEDTHQWDDVEVVQDGAEVTLWRVLPDGTDRRVVAAFSRYDTAVFVVDE